MTIVSFVIAAVLASVLGTAPGQAEPAITSATLAGDWSGTVGGVPLVLHLRVVRGELEATMDSPTQGANGLQGTHARLNGSVFQFEVPLARGSYTGVVSADGRTMQGTWTQGGSTPLDWTKTKTADEVAGPATADEAQVSPLDGDWNGVLRAGGVSLRLTFHFRSASGGGLTGTLDSLDQEAMAIPCADVRLEAKRVSLEVPSVHGSYEGTLEEDGEKISGQWAQGSPIALDLTRTRQTAEPAILLPAQPPVTLAGLKHTLDGEFASVIAAWPQGGIVVGVVDHGQRQVMAWGTARRDSIFEIGSVTKTFTALALAQMALQKKVTLDEPVRALLPAGMAAQSADAEITLADLATQHSGLPRLPDNLAPGNPADPYADYTAQRLGVFLERHGLGRPGTASFLYSNLGLGLLGYALAQRAGVPYGELIRDEVTGPLRMRDTTIVMTAAQRRRFLQGYSGAHDAVGAWHFDVLAGAGALRSTAGDLLTYCTAMMHPERAAGAGAATTLPAAIRMALEPRSDVDADGSIRIALAWMMRPATGVYWHDGGTGGFTSLVSFDAKRDRAIVVLYNCEDNTPGKLPLTEQVAANVSALLDGKQTMLLTE